MFIYSGRAGARSNNTNDFENLEQAWLLLAAGTEGELVDRGRPEETQRVRGEVRHAFSRFVGAESGFSARWCYTDDAACISLGEGKSMQPSGSCTCGSPRVRKLAKKSARSTDTGSNLAQKCRSGAVSRVKESSHCGYGLNALR